MGDAYVFEPIAPEIEQARLHLIEQTFDPTTQQWLTQAGLASGQTCLEVGPGAGSIAQWLTQQVTLAGQVVAIDRDPTHWQNINAPNLEKVICDLTAWLAPTNQFDLIHARYVFIHVPQAVNILKRLWTALKPGGVIVLEEPDFTNAQLIGDPSPEKDAHQRVNQAIAAMFTQKVLEPGWGLRMPAQLVTAGFELERVQAEAHLGAGGSPIAHLMECSTQVLAPAYLATGTTTAEDITLYCENARRPERWAVYYTTVRAIARRPMT